MVPEKRQQKIDGRGTGPAEPAGPPESHPHTQAEGDTREWIAGHPIHAAASLLPLIEDEDLEAMAEDIRARGLRLPVLRNSAGEVVDGRNRLFACEKAGVAPQFVDIDGADSFDEVMSLNLFRRNLNRNQLAMGHMYVRHKKRQAQNLPLEGGFETVEGLAERLRINKTVLYRCKGKAMSDKEYQELIETFARLLAVAVAIPIATAAVWLATIGERWAQVTGVGAMALLWLFWWGASAFCLGAAAWCTWRDKS